MSCNIVKNNLLGCRNSGGVDEIYIADFEKKTYIYNFVNEVLEVSTWTDGSATYSQYIVTGEEDTENPGTQLFPKVGEFFEVRFPGSPFDVLNDTGVEVISLTYDPTTNILVINSNQPTIITGSTIGYSGILVNPGIGNEISIVPTDLVFYSIQQPRETAEWLETPMANIENHSSWYEKTVTLNLFNLANTSNYVKIMTQGKWLVMIRDNNGSYWLTNFISPANVDTVTGGSGKLMSDMNGWSVTFKSMDSISNKIKQGAIDRMINAGQII